MLQDVFPYKDERRVSFINYYIDPVATKNNTKTMKTFMDVFSFYF